MTTNQELAALHLTYAVSVATTIILTTTWSIHQPIVLSWIACILLLVSHAVELARGGEGAALRLVRKLRWLTPLVAGALVFGLQWRASQGWAAAASACGGLALALEVWRSLSRRARAPRSPEHLASRIVALVGRDIMVGWTASLLVVVSIASLAHLLFDDSTRELLSKVCVPLGATTAILARTSAVRWIDRQSADLSP